jgi:6-phosphofructo-2-kinase/fructose-2,6-biphosphatase 2
MADKRFVHFVYSAGFLASVGVVSALAAVLARRAKNKRFNDETSKLSERAVNAPFSADEWHRMRARGDTTDDAAALLEEAEQEPQQPMDHPAMRGSSVGSADGGTEDTFAIVFVGLPGRGKTAVAARTARYLSFFHGVDCELFNVGDRRRDGVGYVAKEGYSNDPAAVKARKAFADQTLNELKLFLLTPGRTAIFDASNITAQRRLEVYSEIKKLGKVEVIFVELISRDTSINAKEMAARDLSGSSTMEDSAEDYKQRVAMYQQVYEPIASGPLSDDHEHNFSYIKCIDHGKQTVLNKIDGYMAGRVAQFITNCCHCHWTTEKRLFISRHGQSEYNATGRIGGDSSLTAMGER